jgi:hypothetical protein
VTPDIAGIIRRRAALALAGVAVAWLAYQLRRSGRELQAAQRRTARVVDQVRGRADLEAEQGERSAERTATRARRRETATRAAPADLAHARESEARGDDWDSRLDDALERGRRAGAR